MIGYGRFGEENKNLKEIIEWILLKYKTYRIKICNIL